VAFTAVSDKAQKEKFQAGGWRGSAGEDSRLGAFELEFHCHDPKKFRHYGPMAQDFFAAFGTTA
jgi:hypothetical protein